jgi:hypothetical protein
MAAKATTQQNTSTDTAKARTDKAVVPVTAATLAEHLQTDPRTLRAFIRGLDLGVGFGSRYTWPSMKDPAVKRIVAAWRKAEKETN